MTTTLRTSGEWKRRTVVSSFIMKSDDRQPRVALFRRSAKVSTYRHHFAPISGTIDPSDASPLAAAWREIAEETKLTPASLAMLRQGKSYTFCDASIHREWTVFPFLFCLKTPADEGLIQTDWEHEGWAWHDPDAVIRGEGGSSLETVPRLAESLRRVWFETDLGPAAGKALADGLGALAHDHESGARQLAGVALRILKDVVAQLDNPNDQSADEWWVKVRSAAWHLWKNGRESMGAAIMSVLLGALAGIERTMQGRRPVAWRDAVASELDARIEARKESAALVSKAFAAYLGKAFALKLSSHEPISILTLSESSTIRQALRHAAVESGFVLDLRVLESRPLYEGVSLAGCLAVDLARSPFLDRLTHRITLYSDASAALASTGIDVVVLGADRIAASGAVSNKTGSLPMVLSAKHVSPTVRVVVLGESDKIALPGQPGDHVVEDNDPYQITRAWQAEDNGTRVRNAEAALHGVNNRAVQIEIRNVYFEWVSAGLIDGYLTESGEWTVRQIAEYSEKLEAEEKRVFESL